MFAVVFEYSASNNSTMGAAKCLHSVHNVKLNSERIIISCF